MRILSRFLSFERPLGPVLVQLLYYAGLITLVLHSLHRLWVWGGYMATDWDKAIWMLVKTPFWLALGVFVLRILSELALAVFRMETHLHDQVTGRAVPPAKH